MPSSFEFKLPDIGEGVAEGEVLNWLVSEGDVVKEDQPLVEVMTDKVNVEIPSPKAGKVARVLAKVGQVVKVGEGLVVFEVEGEEPPKQLSFPPPSRESSVTRKPEPPGAGQVVLATPATRKLANELGVDLRKVVGTGPKGRITAEDVQRAKTALTPQSTVTVTSPPALVPSDEHIPLRGLRRTIAERMSQSAHTAAQVTHVDEADVTELKLLRNTLLSKATESGRKMKITLMPLIIKAVIPALKEYPYVNAFFDDKNQEIVLKKSYNIGIATDTEQGLVVPVVKDADKKDVLTLAAEIEGLVERGRTGKLTLEDVRGATFTLSNVGSIGGLFSTPLVYYPEVAILAIQKIVRRPVVRNDAIAMRDILNLSFSFDHRVFDGGYAGRFLNRVIDAIEEPSSLA